MFISVWQVHYDLGGMYFQQGCSETLVYEKAREHFRMARELFTKVRHNQIKGTLLKKEHDVIIYSGSWHNWNAFKIVLICWDQHKFLIHDFLYSFCCLMAAGFLCISLLFGWAAVGWILERLQNSDRNLWPQREPTHPVWPDQRLHEEPQLWGQQELSVPLYMLRWTEFHGTLVMWSLRLFNQ